MRRRRRRAGAALILVIVVIAALLAVAAPFVISMRLHEQSSRAFEARLRARHLAEAARGQAVAHLMQTHPDDERRARVARGDRAGDDEGVDAWDELQVELGRPAGVQAFVTDDPRGDTAQVEVADLRGRVDLNRSGPDPIANLLGVTVTTADLGYEDDARLEVEDARAFFTDGDPATLDGFVRLGHEYIGYRHRTRTALVGLVRGLFFSREPPPEDQDTRRRLHPAGALVQDGRGYKIAFDALWRHVGTDREGELSRFHGTAGIRQIADWEFGSLRAAMVLWRRGVSLERLRAWGVTTDGLARAGLDAAGLDDDRSQETPAERAAREDAERDLKAWGLSLDVVRRFGGDRAVRRLHAQLDGLDDDRRAKAVEQHKQRQQQLEDQATKLDGWLKDEVRRQLKGMTELRDQAPHVETIGRIELEERVRPFVTTDAPPLAEGWSDPTPVAHPLQYQPYNWVTSFRPQDARRFTPGMIVRIAPRGGGAPEYRYCVNVDRRDTVSVFPQLDRDYEQGEAEVSCRQPGPVNVNAAPREVLAAVLTGLQSRVGQRARAGQAADIVTPAEAQAVADAIVDQAPSSHEQLLGLMLGLRAAGTVTDQDVDAVLRNAIDPGDALLVRSTVPFCYASGDAYELTATGVVHDPQGNVLARHRVREVVRVAPPGPLEWVLDSQHDFTDRLYVPGPRNGPPDPRSGGAAALTLPHVWTNLLQTRPVYLGPYEPRIGLVPSRSHAPGEGDVQPLGPREPDVPQGSNAPPTFAAAPGGLVAASGGPQAGALRQDHWQDQLEGIDLASASVAAGQLGTRWIARPDLTGLATLGPGLVRAWVRLDALPAGKAFVFDGGEGDGINRLSLYFDGPQRLVLEAKGEALDLRESGGRPRPTRLVYDAPRPFRVGNWYHLAAFFRGADRGDLALAVDGRFVGRDTHGSRLTRAIDAWTTELPVEDPDAFPDAGWVRVGANRWSTQGLGVDRGVGGTPLDAPPTLCEVLHYVKRGGALVVDRVLDTSQLAQLLAQGGQVQGGVTIDAASLPQGGRMCERGSGRPLVVRVTNPQGRPQMVQVAGFGYEHAAGTLVVPYGYRSELALDPQAGHVERLRVGGATLAQPLPVHTPTTLLYAPIPGYTLAMAQSNPLFDYQPQVVDALATELPVLWAGPYPDAPMQVARPPVPTGAPPPQPGQAQGPPPTNVTGGFPPVGIVRITSRKQPVGAGAAVVNVERVLYQGVDPVGGRLLNCVRGIEGTTPAPHFLFDEVALESIVVTDPRDYPDRPDLSLPRVLVSLPHATPPLAPAVGVEWLSVQKPADPTLLARGLLLVPVRESLDVAAAQPNQQPPGLLPTFQLKPALIRQMLTGNGTLGAAPGLRVLDDPGYAHHAEWGQPWKEVLKRWETWSEARAQKGTRRPDPPAGPGHGVQTRVVPTFAVRLLDAREAGRDDVVTVADDQPGVTPREEQVVAHGALALRGQNDAVDGWLLALDGFVSREYRADAGARLARWPTGNVHRVPDLALGRARAPSGPSDVVADAPGTLAARLDDLVVMQLDEPSQPLLRATLGPGDLGADAQGNEAQWEGRLVRTDGEVLAVTEAQRQQGGVRLTLLRGALGTPPAAQSPETYAWRLDWPATLAAGSGFTGVGGQAVAIRRTVGPFRERDGYAAIDRGGGLPFAGILPFEARQGNRALIRPVDLLGRGCYPAAFGAAPGVPQAGDLLVDLPFRVHDRYADGVSSLDGVFLQAGRELPGAFVEAVTWDEQLPNPFCEVKVLARVDGAPGWDGPRANGPGQAGRLYVFDDPRQPNRIELRANRVELRVHLTLKAGAYLEDAWKQGALVGAVRVRYRQPVQVLRREERAD